MKKLYKIVTILALLGGLAFAAKAQTVIGSWQSAPIPPSPANDEGWFQASGGLSDLGSIFAPAQMPGLFELKAGVAAGYAQSVDIHETGYGNVRLAINLTAAQIHAFTNNTTLNYTISVQPGDAGTASGYIQQVDFQWNPSVGGFHNGAPSTAKGFSEIGDTGNNSSGQPIFYYYTTAPARQQVVSWTYSSQLTNFIGSSYIELVWVFQVSGGELTNIYINNVNLSGAEGNPSIIIDRFNPTNAYAGTNDYDIPGLITNVYNVWTGYGGNGAVNPEMGGVSWDNTQDAGGGAVGSGSLKLIANFTNNNQFLIWDRGFNNTFALNPPITNGYSLLTFEFDLKVDPSSPQFINGGTTNYAGAMEAGPVPPYGPIDFGTYFYYNVTNTGWIHIVLPVDASSDPADLLSISGIYFKQYAFGLNGTATYWIDNIKFTYTNLPPVIPPPTVTIQKPEPGLRLFTGGTDQYGRTELIAQDSDSWVNATGGNPATYSFTVKSIPANMAQTAIFLIPLSSIPDTAYNGQDYNASAGLWLTISPGGVAQVMWKTNLPGSNPNNIALRMTNTPAAGTWTLSFTGPNNGTVTGPGGSPQPFVITNGTVTTDFADPVWAYFGCQANSGAAIGNFEDWSSITITGTASPRSEDFTTEPTHGTTLVWGTAYQGATDAGAAVIVSTNDLPAYWVSWTLPAIGFSIGSKTNLLQTGGWISPQYYAAYFVTAPYGAEEAFGMKDWVLETKATLPTADGGQGTPLSPTAFFIVETNTLIVNP